MLVLERMLLKCITVLPPKTLLQLGAVFSMLTVCVIFSPKESMHRRAELAGLNNNYRTELVREEVFFTS